MSESDDQPPPDLFGPNDYGVLLSDQIQWLVDHKKLIVDGSFQKQNLERASYDLTLGEECYSGSRGRFVLTDLEPILTIEPYDVAVVSTGEKLLLPGYIIGRFNIRIGLVYRGVLLVTGPQVDPGYQGRLYTVLYNFSTQPIQLRLGEHIATIDFIRTTTPTKDTVPFKQKRRNFGDYLMGLQSAPKKDLLERLATMEGRLDRFITLQWSILGGVILAVIALVLAVVSIIL